MGKSIICPICKKPGYIVKEKPRKKHETPTLRDWYKSDLTWSEYNEKHGYQVRRYDNIPHKDYRSANRVSSEYFRIKHHSGKPFCYIGAPNSILRKIEIVIMKLDHVFQHRAMEWLPELRNAVDVILTKNQLTEDDVRFLVNLKRQANDPFKLRKWLELWLDIAKQMAEHRITKSEDSELYSANISSLRTPSVLSG